MSLIGSKPPAPSTPAGVVIFRPCHEHLQGLLAAIGNGRRVYAFLNGSCDSEVHQMLRHSGDVRVLLSPDNVGLGAGLNAVVSASLNDGFDSIVLFDQDSSPSPDLVDILADRWRALCVEGRKVAALGPRLGAPSDQSHKVIKHSLRHGRLASDIVNADFLPTSGSLVSTQAWTEIGPFREDYFVGGIDVEWGFRAWRAGYASACLLGVVMIHRWGSPVHHRASWKPQIIRQSDLRTFYYVRNSVDLLRKRYVPVRWRAKFALRLMGQLGLLILWRLFDRRIRVILGSAIRDGVNGQLGRAPASIEESA